jgi:hypothetical protein
MASYVPNGMQGMWCVFGRRANEGAGMICRAMDFRSPHSQRLVVTDALIRVEQVDHHVVCGSPASHLPLNEGLLLFDLPCTG